MHRAYKKKNWDNDGVRLMVASLVQILILRKQILVVKNRHAVLKDRETGKESAPSRSCMMSCAD